jgi:hypothetical protein
MGMTVGTSVATINVTTGAIGITGATATAATMIATTIVAGIAITDGGTSVGAGPNGVTTARFASADNREGGGCCP